MSRPRRRTRGPSRLRVLAGMLALAIPGFALGGLLGLLWEDPGLVASYVFGGTREVALAPDAAQDSFGSQGGPLPAVAAAPTPAPPAVEPSKPRAAPEPPREAAPPARREAPATGNAGSGRVAVQVGAFGEKSAADRLASSLRDKGYPVYVAAGEAGGAPRWRVRVGPLGTRDEGERQAARLKREERLPTWVLEEQ